MRKLGSWVGVVALFGVPFEALAQADGGVSDTGVHIDAAQPDTAVSPDAHVNDAGVTTDAGTGCGNLTIFGECNGRTLRICSEGVLVTRDCAADNMYCGIVDCGQGAECYSDYTTQQACTADTDCAWSATSNECYANCWGYDCVAHSGDACELSDLDDDGFPDRFCETGLSCMNGVCATGVACDYSSDPPSTCSGSTVTYCYFTDFEASFDCSGGGADPYTCGLGTMSGANGCLGVAGGNCDLTHDPPWECAAGFRCSSNSAAGTCLANTDAGTSRDAGTRRDTGTTGGTDSATGGDDDGGGVCGCSGVNAGASALAIVVAMLGLALIRRRR